MMILYIVHEFYPEFHTGTEKFVLNVSSSVQKNGNFVQVVAYTFSEEREKFERSEGLLVRNYVYRSLPVVVLRHQTAPIDIHSYYENQEIYKFAREFLQKKRYDLLHIGHLMRLAPFAKAALDLGIPYVFTLTDFWMICPKFTLQTSAGSLCMGPEGAAACGKLCPELEPAFVKSRLAAGKEILAGAKAVVAPSKFLAAVFRNEFPDLNIQIIPHGLDFQYLKSNSKRYEQSDKIVFGYCGGLSPHKGLHVLLKAFRELNPANAEVRVYGAAFHDKAYFRILQQIAGDDERIKFCGTYTEEQVGEILANIDVIIVPSVWYENYPLILHEALACNVPVVASNIGGMAEKIKDSANGFTFQVGDEKDLAGKLKLIVDNPRILNGIKERMRHVSLPRVEEEAYLYERLYRTTGSQS
ncbi:MAG TPA: glycosyltransferase family 4 protein [Terriglobia bacterium]|nr:glycosyltransferase family 4 protein [Terriglobia bacterium]